MKVLLISDLSTEESAASMVVGVGSINDPRKVPGLANIVGYALMMGSKKYPEPYSFREFVRSDGGVAELPKTEKEEQLFSFQIKSALFAQALRMFTQFFLEPFVSYMPILDLRESLTSAWLKQNECALNDDQRILETEDFLSKPNHPFQHPVTGEALELFQMATGFSLQNDVQKFYSTWYSSNIMTLTVLGKENLNELEKMVVSLFRKVVDKDKKNFKYPFRHHPWGPEQLKRKTCIKPLAIDKKVLRLKFPVPNVADCGTTPDLFINWGLVHGGPRSLFSIFKEKNWCTDFHVDYDPLAKFAFFTIVCNLTDEGFDRQDDIINLIFQFIHIIRENNIQEQMFNEFKKASEYNFLQWTPEDNGELLSFVERVSVDLQRSTFRDAVHFWANLSDWNPKLLGSFLDYLRPQNMNISIVSPTFKEYTDGVTTRTGFEVQKIPEKLIEIMWSHRALNCLEMNIPSKRQLHYTLSNSNFKYYLQKWNAREFIPELQALLIDAVPGDFAVRPVEEDALKDPYVVYQSPKMEIWFKQDDKFRTPEIHVFLDLFSPSVALGPFHRVSLHVLCHMVRFSLVQSSDLSQFEWIKWDLSLINYGIQITLNGYSDKVILFLEKIITKMMNLWENVRSDDIKGAKETHIRSSKTPNEINHFQQLYWYIEHLHNQGGWTPDDIFYTKRFIRIEDIMKFSNTFYRRIFIRGFMYGNCSKEGAEEVAKILENLFQSSGHLLLQELLLRSRNIEFADASHHVYQAFNREPDIYGYSSFFNLNINSLKIDPLIVAFVLHEIIQKSCEQILSLQDEDDISEVRCALINKSEVRGYAISARTKKSPRIVDRRLGNFLKSVPKILIRLEDSDIEMYKGIVAKKLLRLSSSLTQMSDVYWYEIVHRYYKFDRIESDLNQLYSLTRDDLLSFVSEIFDVRSPQRRKLSINLLPETMRQTNSSLMHEFPSGATIIEDIDAFKTSSSLLPFNISSIPLTTKLTKILTNSSEYQYPNMNSSCEKQ